MTALFLRVLVPVHVLIGNDWNEDEQPGQKEEEAHEQTRLQQSDVLQNVGQGFEEEPIHHHAALEIGNGWRTSSQVVEDISVMMWTFERRQLESTPEKHQLESPWSKKS